MWVGFVQQTLFSYWLFGISVAALSGCSTLPNAAQLQHEESKVAIAHKIGSTPIVVFQSGLGDGMSVWSAVLQRLPSAVGTFAYDRPGYGGSSSKHNRRDPCSVARELHEMLRIADIHPPYVLVGHSLGGLYQYAYAKLYPSEVSGILLLDATHPEHWATMQRRVPNSAATVRGLRAIAFSDTERREFDAQSECIADLRGKDTPPVTARLLLRGNAEPTESAEFQSMSRELASRWPELLSGMTISTVDGTGHYIQKGRPEVVAREIGILVSTVQAKQP